MSAAEPANSSSKIVPLQERRLGGTVFRTSPMTVDVDQLVPNQLRLQLGPAEDEEMQSRILADQGVYPLLVERLPGRAPRFRIIDGHRRWSSALALARQDGDRYRRLPVEVADRTLSEDEWLDFWIKLHRDQKGWEAQKVVVAYLLFERIGPAGAATRLGIKTSEVDRLVEVFKLSRKFTRLRDPAAAITWARELNGLSKKLLTPTVMEAVVEKANQGRITNSKDLRELREILRDPVARAHFLSQEGTIDSARQRLAPPEPKGVMSPVRALEAAVASLKQTPVGTLEELRGQPRVIALIDEAEALLGNLREYLSASTRRSGGGSTSTGSRRGRGR